MVKVFWKMVWRAGMVLMFIEGGTFGHEREIWWKARRKRGKGVVVVNESNPTLPRDWPGQREEKK